MNLKEDLQRLAQRLVHRYRELIRTRKHLGDLERINIAADRLNLEAADVLNYQASDFPVPLER